ncbi:MAG: DUF6864 domain-containing function [Flavobacterium sp.]
MEVKVVTGDYTVEHSGFVHIKDGDPLKLMIDNVAIEFLFVKSVGDSTTKDASANYKIEDGILKLSLIDYDSITPIGVFDPWRIGKDGGRYLYLTFSVQTIFTNNSPTVRLINYVIYTREEVLNG